MIGSSFSAERTAERMNPQYQYASADMRKEGGNQWHLSKPKESETSHCWDTEGVEKLRSPNP